MTTYTKEKTKFSYSFFWPKSFQVAFLWVSYNDMIYMNKILCKRSGETYIYRPIFTQIKKLFEKPLIIVIGTLLCQRKIEKS